MVCGCGHAGRGVRTNAGRRSSRSRQRHATDGVLTMTLRGDKVFCQLLYSLFCKSVCKPSCKLVYVNLFVHYSGHPSVHEYVDGFVRHFICHCCMAPMRLCVYAVYRLVHVLLSKLAFPTGIQSSLCRRDCRTLRTPVARRVCRPRFRPL